MDSRKEILDYLIISIQNGKLNQKINSNRQLGIKFDISKSLISSILKNLQQNNLIQIQNKKGSKIYKGKGSMFFSYSNHHNIDSKNIFIQKTDIKKEELFFLKKQTFLNSKNICISNFLIINKKYYFNNKVKKIKLMIKKPINKESNSFLKLKESLFSYLAYNNYSIYSKISSYKKMDGDIYKFEFFLNDKKEIICFSSSKVLSDEFGLEIKNIY